MRTSQARALLPEVGHAAPGGTHASGVRGCRKDTGLCSHAIQHGALMEPQQQRHHGRGQRPAQGRGRRTASALAHEVRPLQLLTSRGEDRQVNSAGVTSLYLLQGFLKHTKGAFIQVGKTCCSITSINRKCQIVFAEVFYCSVWFCFLIFILWFH